MPIITPEVAAFIEGPNSIMVASHDEHLVPAIARALRVVCAGGDDQVTVDMPTAASAEVLAQLARDGRIAIVCELSSTHRTLQIKGRATAIFSTPASEQTRVLHTVARFFEVCEQLGLPRRLTDRMVRWPATSVVVKVDQVFEQSPGPGAGEPWRAPPPDHSGGTAP